MIRNEKILIMTTALMDVYKDEDNRDLSCFSKIEIINGEMTEDL